MSNLLKVSLLVSIFFLGGCSSEKRPHPKNGFSYHGVYFGEHLSSAFKHGIRDGCETSRGVYTKSHRLFNNDNDYYNGWFTGRNKCRHLLEIDENGDLVL
jgi:hypothetical protein